MRPWMIPGLILLSLWLLSLLRIGASASYDDTGFVLRLRAGPLWVTLFPPRRREKPPRAKEKKKPAKEPEEPPARKGGSLALVRKFLPLGCEAAGRFKNKVRIDSIRWTLIWGAPDPAAAAIGYGMANAALGMLWPLVEHNFLVRERELDIQIDYGAGAPRTSIYAALSLTIGQAVVMSVVLGVKALRLLLEYRKETKRKEAV